MSPVTFEVGNRYENMKGPYVVLAVEGNVMRIKWEDGEEMTTSTVMQRRILERLEQERQAGNNQTIGEEQDAQPQSTPEKAIETGSTPKATQAGQETTGIRKKYLKTRKVCRVTFILPQAISGEADSVCVVGDFNDWNNTANPMKKTKGKGFTVTLELQQDREYQFRYLIDGARWENDPHADKYVKSPFEDSENSVVAI